MTNRVEPSIVPSGTVVVGLDGSEASRHALVWAVHKSDILGEIVPVATYQPQVSVELIGRAGADPSLYRTAAESEMMAVLDEVDPALKERAKLVEAHPGAGLIAACVDVDADLLVLGTRGRSSLTAALLGSVSSYCVKQARIPVAVIPPEFPATNPIVNAVVGIDGSPSAAVALRWAVDRVDPDGTIYAVGALSAWGSAGPEYDASPEVLCKALDERVNEVVASVTGPGYAGATIDVATVAKDARVALRELAGSDADLLVVGARGTAGVPFLLLGSVSTALVHHPTVPTVVIPADRGTTSEDD